MSQGCARWRLDLGAHVVGALDAEEREAMTRHLADCPACRAEYEDLLPVGDWLARTKRHVTACPACCACYADLLNLALT